MSTLEQPGKRRPGVYLPGEALRRVRPLPRREDLVIEDVPDEEWNAFQEALAET